MKMGSRIAAYKKAKEKRQVKRAKDTRRRTAKKQNTPAWADLDAIQAFIDATPEGMEADHIYPLQSKKVSGLHVLENFQYLTIAENRRKKNKFPTREVTRVVNGVKLTALI